MSPRIEHGRTRGSTIGGVPGYRLDVDGPDELTEEQIHDLLARVPPFRQDYKSKAFRKRFGKQRNGEIPSNV